MNEILEKETRFEQDIDKVFAYTFIVSACIDYMVGKLPYIYFSFVTFVYMLYNIAIILDLNTTVDNLCYSRINRELIARYTALRRLDKRVKKCYLTFSSLIIGVLYYWIFESDGTWHPSNLAKLVFSLLAGGIMIW